MINSSTNFFDRSWWWENGTPTITECELDWRRNTNISVIFLRREITIRQPVNRAKTNEVMPFVNGVIETSGDALVVLSKFLKVLKSKKSPLIEWMQICLFSVLLTDRVLSRFIDYECSTKSSGNLLGTPVLNLSTNPDNRPSTQSNLLREVPLLHESIDGGLGEAGDFFNLRQTKKLSRSKH